MSMIFLKFHIFVREPSVDPHDPGSLLTNRWLGYHKIPQDKILNQVTSQDTIRIIYWKTHFNWDKSNAIGSSF